MNNSLELLLFTTDADLALRCEAAGVDGFIVDWESRGKTERQQGHDMEVNADTAEDVRRLSTAVKSPITVRINAIGPHSEAEIEKALSHGACGLMLPMAYSPGEVRRFLDLVDNRARTIVQIETQSLVEAVSELAELPWSSAYIGLHDLMLSRNASCMWEAVLDGTVESVFETLQGRNVGFAGATIIGGGYPIRFTMILQELARLGAGLTFLRRSFRREIQDRDIASEIASVRTAWSACQARGPEAVDSDRESFYAQLDKLVSADG